MRDTSPRRFVAWFLATVFVVLVPVTLLNLVLSQRSLPGGPITFEASRWQERTHGVTYSPPLGDNRAFKTLRLHDRAPHVDTLVFGSSTMMGFTTAILPADMPGYNFSQSSNPYPGLIAEVRHVLDHGPVRLRWAVMSVDWALGYAFRKDYADTELSPASVRAAIPGGVVPFLERLGDGLTLPRVTNLFEIGQGILRAEDRIRAFREVFVDDGGPEYRCGDGTVARDFDAIFRGSCTGFRYDGAATFGSLRRIGPDREPIVLNEARAPDGRYARALVQSGGVMDPGLLMRLAKVSADLKARDGRLILVLPPLVPGLEKALLAMPEAGAALRRLKADLHAWARAADAVIVDAAAAEDYGCPVNEFVDAHHGLPDCYRRVFARLPMASLRAAPGGVYAAADAGRLPER